MLINKEDGYHRNAYKSHFQLEYVQHAMQKLILDIIEI